MDGNYIKFYRKFLEWEWYRNINTKVLFLHMLLKANWKEGKFEGKKIEKGSFVSSIPKLSLETDLTTREVRTAIEHLKTTGELTVKSHSKYSVFTINNYCLYQSSDTQNVNQTADKRQTNDILLTDKRHANDMLTTTIEERKNIRREEEEEKKEGKNGNKKSSTATSAEKMMELFDRLLPDFQISEPLKEKIQDWLKYKAERKDSYKEQGMKSLITTIYKHANQYGDVAVIDLIDECMASGWVGIIWDRINNKNQKGSAYMNSIKNRVSEVDNWV